MERVEFCKCYPKFEPGMAIPVEGDLRRPICSKCHKPLNCYKSIEEKLQGEIDRLKEEGIPVFSKKRFMQLAKENASLTAERDELKKILSDIVYWELKSRETPEMLLSSKHEKTDECSRIMSNFFKAIAKANQLLKTEESK